ncbi:hypothetical protein QBC39DRAFT_76888 [Podospora conica]|nr:hypothetical protein QBC39DRAFT_76888 [Schizothecium conicum]
MPPKRKTKATTASTANARPSRTNSANPAPIPAILLSDDDDADNENSHHHKAALINSDDDLDELISYKRPVKKARKAPAKPRGGGAAGGARGGARAGAKTKKPAATVEQHLMEQNAKSKEFIQGFREEVRAEREKVWGALEKMKAGLERTAAAAQKKPVADYDRLKTAPVMVDKGNNPLYKQTQELMRLSRSMVHRHRALERETERPGLNTPRETWKEDGEEMSKLLACGRQYGERLVAGLISPDGVGEIGNDAGGGEVDGMVKELFTSVETSDTWGRVAGDQVKALTEVVKTLAPHRE